MDRFAPQSNEEDRAAASESLPAATSSPSVLSYIADWTDSRLPLPELLRAIAEEYSGGSRRAFCNLAERLDQGESLEQAFASTQQQFPRKLRRPLELAAGGGDLQTALPALAIQEATRKDVRRQIVSSLLYPITVLLFCVFLALLASLLVIPQFAAIFEEFELDLPAMTELVVNSSAWVPFSVAVLAVSAVACCVLWVTPSVRWLMHWLATATPLFGTLWIWISHHALCEQLSAYLSAQTPLPTALRGTAAGLGNRRLALAVEKIADSCEQGVPLSEAMGRSIHLERMLTTMVRWGENCDTLPTTFSEASVIYRKQIENYLAFIRRISAPCMIVTVGAAVGTVVAALFLPLVRLIEGLT